MSLFICFHLRRLLEPIPSTSGWQDYTQTSRQTHKYLSLTSIFFRSLTKLLVLKDLQALKSCKSDVISGIKEDTAAIRHTLIVQYIFLLSQICRKVKWRHRKWTHALWYHSLIVLNTLNNIHFAPYYTLKMFLSICTQCYVGFVFLSVGEADFHKNTRVP